MESHTKNKQILDYKDLSKYINLFYKKLLKKSLDKYFLHKYYQQLIFFNKSKFNYNYLQYLKKYLEKIYKKNVEFNLVNLKRFYLNSDILSESITLKIRKNRRKLLKFLNTLKRKVKVRNKKNIYYKPTLNKLNNIDKKYIEGVILRDIKYMYVNKF